jgi:hypothetical protein
MALYPLWFNSEPTAVITSRDRIWVGTGTNTSVTISNLLGGAYRAEFSGLWTKTTNWFWFPDTNGQVIAAQWPATNYLKWSNVPGYSTAQADLLFLRKTDGTNMFDLAGAAATATNFHNINVDIVGTIGVGGYPIAAYDTLYYPLGYALADSSGSIYWSNLQPFIDGHWGLIYAENGRQIGDADGNLTPKTVSGDGSGLRNVAASSLATTNVIIYTNLLFCGPVGSTGTYGGMSNAILAWNGTIWTNTGTLSSSPYTCLTNRTDLGSSSWSLTRVSSGVSIYINPTGFLGQYQSNNVNAKLPLPYLAYVSVTNVAFTDTNGSLTLLSITDPRLALPYFVPSSQVFANISAAFQQASSNLMMVFTPEMFGATGNNTSEDAVAVQAGFDAVTSSARPAKLVCCPLSSYKCSTNIFLRGFVNVEGNASEDNFPSQYTFNFGTNGGFSLQRAGQSQVFGLQMKNISMHGPGDALPHANSAFDFAPPWSVGSYGGQNVNLEHIRITGFKTALLITNLDTVHISAVVADQCSNILVMAGGYCQDCKIQIQASADGTSAIIADGAQVDLSGSDFNPVPTKDIPNIIASGNAQVSIANGNLERAVPSIYCDAATVNVGPGRYSPPAGIFAITTNGGAIHIHKGASLCTDANGVAVKSYNYPVDYVTSEFGYPGYLVTNVLAGVVYPVNAFETFVANPADYPSPNYLRPNQVYNARFPGANYPLLYALSDPVLGTNAVPLGLGIFQQQASAPAARDFWTVPGRTNHMYRCVNGLQMDYWSDGTTVYSKQLAP